MSVELGPTRSRYRPFSGIHPRASFNTSVLRAERVRAAELPIVEVRGGISARVGAQSMYRPHVVDGPQDDRDGEARDDPEPHEAVRSPRPLDRCGRATPGRERGADRTDSEATRQDTTVTRTLVDESGSTSRPTG